MVLTDLLCILCIPDFDCGQFGEVQWEESQREDNGFRLVAKSSDGIRTTMIDYLCDPNFEGTGSLEVGPDGGKHYRLRC